MRNVLTIPARRERGFTVFELMVVISIMGLMSYVALPQLSELSAAFDRLNAKTYLVQDLKRAQAEAITQGCRGIFVVAADAESYSYGCDYLSYDTANPPSHDSASFVRNLPSDVTISIAAPLIFNSRGQSVDVDYIISNNSISLMKGGTTFASGTLLGTGVFDFD